MAKKRRSRETPEVELNMTPFIDIVFQLLIFFVLQAKFIEFEGELRSYLPKNRGLNPSDPQFIDLANVTMFLDWVDEGDGNGRCEAVTASYKPPAGGPEQRQYKFPGVTGETFKQNKKVPYPYPDFNEVKDYIKFRKETYSGIGFGLPVTINFTDKVPMQMIINVIDICTELQITDFAINAQGVD